MPSLSLVVCVYQERDLLSRLLRNAEGCYDDLVVVHDGPDTTGARTIVETAGGKFFERPHAYQQEPHWPFAWAQAKHDWILRLDTDEFPSDELKAWLQKFRQPAEPSLEISGYTCIWPLWNGRRTVSKKLGAGRIFLIHRQRVRFFGMVEQSPVPDGRYEALDMVLHHQPLRKSYGLHNILFRKQAYHWRRVIAQSLLGQPTDLNCWRWDKEAEWPPTWEEIRRHPFSTALRRLLKSPLLTLRDQWKTERKIFPLAALSNPLHHALLCLTFWRLRRQHLRQEKPGEQTAD
jgi:hypothetical protein